MEFFSLIDAFNVFNQFLGLAPFDVCGGFVKINLRCQRFWKYCFVLMVGLSVLELTDLPKVGESDSLFFSGMLRSHFFAIIGTDLVFLMYLSQNGINFLKLYQSWQVLKNVAISKPSQKIPFWWAFVNFFWLCAIIIAAGARAYLRTFIRFDDIWVMIKMFLVFSNALFSFFLQQYPALLFCNYVILLKIYVHNLNEWLSDLMTKHTPSIAFKRLGKVDLRYINESIFQIADI